MRLFHTLAATSVAFDDPNLVSAAGLVPVLALADRAGLGDLADRHLTVPSDKGANAGLKVASLVAGMAAGADSIEDMALLRHGGMSRLFARAYAPSTLGSFLRSFSFGHVRQLDAVASRFLGGLARRCGVLSAPGWVFVDVDDTVIEVHGHRKQGSGYGYSGVRGLNALLATAHQAGAAPVVVAQRLRKGACASPRGAKRLVADAVRTTRRITGPGARVLVRADAGFYGSPTIAAALRAGAQVSVTVRLNPHIRAAIAGIGEDAWTGIDYPQAVRDEATGEWISRAEVAEVPYVAFGSAKSRSFGISPVAGRLVVRRVPDVNAAAHRAAGQDTLFDTWRFHAFFTTTDPEQFDTVAADHTHRQHAVIEQVHADLKSAALAHLPSAKFAANAAWLVLAVMAFNLTRAAATLTDSDLARATTATIRRRLITVPARAATSARRLTLHLPKAWPWQSAWTTLIDRVNDPPPTLAA